jgi:hypothetical protein
MRVGRREGAGRPKGAKNQRTVAVEKAMQVVAEKLKQTVPQAFEGDGVAYMQSVYRDPSFLRSCGSMRQRRRPALSARRWQRLRCNSLLHGRAWMCQR